MAEKGIKSLIRKSKTIRQPSKHDQLSLSVGSAVKLKELLQRRKQTCMGGETDGGQERKCSIKEDLRLQLLSSLSEVGNEM